MIQLDTQALLWIALEPHRLSVAARRAIESAGLLGETISLAAITLWEIAQLTQRGRIVLGSPLLQFLSDIEEKFEIVPITVSIAIAAAGFPAPFPKDPMDRLIAATALATNRTLVTADQRILTSKACKLLW